MLLDRMGNFHNYAYHPDTSELQLNVSIIFMARLVSNARCTLADPMPRLGPDAVGSADVNGFLTRHRLSGTHREALGRLSADWKLERAQCNCLSEGDVINKTPSPYQPTQMYASRHSANVNGVPTRHWKGLSRLDRLMCSGHKKRKFIGSEPVVFLYAVMVCRR